MQETIKANVKKLFSKTFSEDIISIVQLPISGSARLYFRILSASNSVIATYNKDKKENFAFLYLSKLFKKNGINVPEIYAQDFENDIYLQEDIGNTTLFDLVKKLSSKNNFTEDLVDVYKMAIEQLAEIQINGNKDLDYSVCYPREAFDKQSIMWDLNYFKYDFLKLTDVLFDEQLLENDFNTFSDYLLKTNTDFFLFRDFQSRNIMLKDGDVYFIDYQGGRRGALQYDLASLLLDAKANIPQNVKNELLEHYIKSAKKLTEINEQEFKEYYFAYALIRIMQAMGAYGFRGLFEKKQHFIDSIPFALKNLESILHEVKILNELPELKRVLAELINSKKLKDIEEANKLKVTIKSFSFKRGWPYDNSGNGGGHVFDCRFIDNPGRIEEYKKQCGKDEPVINFLEVMQETHVFFASIKQIVTASVKNYQSRSFKNLAINFGCTGGQHRSIYFAERTAKFLKENFDVNVELVHTEGF